MDFQSNSQEVCRNADSSPMPSGLVLYSYWHSSCSWRIRFALSLKGLSYEYKAINLTKGEQFSPEFEQLNPLHFVPVLVDGDLVVSDSYAIFLYLEEKYPQKALLPLDPWVRAVNLQAASIINSSIQPLHMLTVLKYIEEKVGPEERLSWAQHSIEKGFVALEKLLEGFVGRYATGDEVYMWVGIRTSLPLPSGWEVCLQLFIYFVLEDFSHYWLHRLLLHSKWGYQNIHRVHHEFTAPIGLAAPYVHWAELIILGFPQILGPAIAPGHMVTYWLWFILREMVATETHCGYYFPWSPSKFIPFYGGAEFHDYHHRVGNGSKGNFASIFRYCDLIYGTDKGYRYKKNTTGKEPSISISNFTLKMHE